MSFFCHQCGLCCKRLDVLLNKEGRTSVVRDMIDEFPYRHEGGVCEKLVDEKCSVYEDRPDLCRVDRFAARVYPNLDINVFHRIVEGSCQSLMRMSGQYTEEQIQEIYETEDLHRRVR